MRRVAKLVTTETWHTPLKTFSLGKYAADRVRIRAMQTIVLTPGDFALVLAMNNAAVPNVNHGAHGALAELIAMAELTTALADGDTVLGFVVAMRPATGYG